MNKYKLLSIAVAIASALPLMAQPQRAASSGGASPHETIGAVIGDRRTGCRVTVTYGRPYSVKPGTTEVRKIWGGLVPWGKAWRMGSDEATTLITQQPLSIGGTTVPAGAYTLYMVPQENGTSKLAISKKIGQWGVPVDESQDLARVDLKKDATDKSYDQFTMAVERDQATGGGVLKMMWENTQFSVPFTVQKP